MDLTLQVVKAFVVLSPAFSSSDLEGLARDLQEHVKQATAPYKYPRKVSALEEKLGASPGESLPGLPQLT